MERLSIVIPCMANCDRLESTLLSVLSSCAQSAMAQPEILCIDRTQYYDPYGLDGNEIRIIDAPRRANLDQLIRIGIEESQSSIVHIIGSGLEVEPGWTDTVLPLFSNAELGSVVPVCWDTGETSSTESASVGVRLCQQFRRHEISLSGSDLERRRFRTDMIGPAWFAGFYRREALLEVDAFDGRYSSRFSDVDVAGRLESAGYLTLVETRSQLFQGESRESDSESMFQFGQKWQRFLLEKTSTTRIQSRSSIIFDAARGLLSPSRFAFALGRIVSNQKSDSRPNASDDASLEPVSLRLPSAETEQRHFAETDRFADSERKVA